MPSNLFKHGGVKACRACRWPGMLRFSRCSVAVAGEPWHADPAAAPQPLDPAWQHPPSTSISQAEEPALAGTNLAGKWQLNPKAKKALLSRSLRFHLTGYYSTYSQTHWENSKDFPILKSINKFQFLVHLKKNLSFLLSQHLTCTVRLWVSFQHWENIFLEEAAVPTPFFHIFSHLPSQGDNS